MGQKSPGLRVHFRANVRGTLNYITRPKSNVAILYSLMAFSF